MSFISLFNSKENKNSVYRGRDCIEKFCKDLKGLATKVISYEEKDMISLTDNENKFYEEQKNTIYLKKSFVMIKMKKKKFKIKI